jgi:2-oxo-4-hydroxy-4-carboxy-5-ureidoimidazoline decarboxylase
VLLQDFNTVDAAEAAALVSVWADIPSFVDGIVASRPYTSVDEVAARASQLAAAWDEADLDAALAHHPRIGEKPTASGAEGDASRREQASMASAGEDTTARIADGNAEYERRFGRVFLIRAAGRAPEEMLAELERRLANDPSDEWREAAAQLGEIAVLRLRGAVTDDRMGA